MGESEEYLSEFMDLTPRMEACLGVHARFGRAQRVTILDALAAHLAVPVDALGTAGYAALDVLAGVLADALDAAGSRRLDPARAHSVIAAALTAELGLEELLGAAVQFGWGGRVFAHLQLSDVDRMVRETFTMLAGQRLADAIRRWVGAGLWPGVSSPLRRGRPA